MAQEGHLDVVVDEPEEAQEAIQVDAHSTRGMRTNRKQPRVWNQVTGKMSTKGSAFSHQNWGGQTASYYMAVANRSDETLANVVCGALCDLATNRDDSDEALLSSVLAPDVLDPRAQMCTCSLIHSSVNIIPGTHHNDCHVLGSHRSSLESSSSTIHSSFNSS